MEANKLQGAIRQFIAATVALMLLLIGSLGTGIFVFGPTEIHRLATFEATHLSDIELSQLVGTPQYTANHQSNTMSQALGANFHFPFSNPVKMVTDELPQTNVQLISHQQTQSSLFSSITQWALTSNKIAMGWLPSNSATSCIQMLQDNPGITVASPTWFHLKDTSGNISGTVQKSVVTYAHKHGIKVWVLVDNQFNAKMTHEVLQNKKARVNLEDELAYQAKIYDLDGINLDFENVSAADRGAFTAFVKELHQKLAAQNTTLSVDIAPDIVQLNDNQAFFHAALANYADYVVLMAYDEHWGSDQEPGPVADVPWVTNSVNDLLDTGVPTSKLVLGLPFYTRFWYVHKNGHVTSEAISDGNIQNILNKHNATGTLNKSLDLMYAKYPEPDGYEEVWYPTAQTFKDKLSLVNSNGLAGISVWSLELSDKKTWSSVLNGLQQSGTS